MPLLASAVLLCLFWLLLSGHYTGLLLSLGVLSVLLVLWTARRMNRVDGASVKAKVSLSFFGYIFWLLWAVVKANVDVVRRIWDPEMPIDPRWRRLDIKVTSNLDKTLYANSITLTPGTLTTEVCEDHFLVHALSEEGIRDLEEGEMERRIQRLGL
ncbi:hypothetical protein BOW53_11455 [Solemya pervernicosa gill symbiont]|uniref:Cation transporter n=1 Tax=Solemya pervernicosa gill symbiont TaxID=642797 RepID=A0A1T2L334_9GAMM|nr:Na+/H+ antiporter subunit E [Solemya pervernicosa gill symbiont]OOZ39517.1 hypothetical protein BOW53_11455 [Solemya pervernicosa gill symbiont]